LSFVIFDVIFGSPFLFVFVQFVEFSIVDEVIFSVFDSYNYCSSDCCHYSVDIKIDDKMIANF